ncbi:MAG: adenylate kinase [Spirochaetota bacterium]|nr:adenylate kinase [Spirochaetota bacterium]
MRAILLGPPGSGKGTQAELMVDRLALCHISTGDMLRKAVSDGVELGALAKSYMDKGQLVPDDVIIGIIEQRIKHVDCNHGFLLDGFPRTIPQADALTEMLSQRNAEIHHVIHIHVEDDELVKRLLGRALKEGRSDDNEDTIKNRLQVYHSQTKPLINYYEERNLLRTVKGIGTVDDVFQQILEVLE